MMAPVALYPDSVLSQLLMASTYPSDVAEAAAWSAQHKDAKGDEAVKQVENQEWDPSVKSLVAFPQVLDQLASSPTGCRRPAMRFSRSPRTSWSRSSACAAGAEGRQPQIERAAERRRRRKCRWRRRTTAGRRDDEHDHHRDPAEQSGDGLRAVVQPDDRVRHMGISIVSAAVLAAVAVLLPGLLPGRRLGDRHHVGHRHRRDRLVLGRFRLGPWRRRHQRQQVQQHQQEQPDQRGGRDQINGGNRGNRGNGNQKWSHNAQNRRGTPYADYGSRQQVRAGRRRRAGSLRLSRRYVARRQPAARAAKLQSLDGQSGQRAAANGGANRGGAGGRVLRIAAGGNGGGAGAGIAAVRAPAAVQTVAAQAADRDHRARTWRRDRAATRSVARARVESQRQASRGQSSQRSMSSSGGAVQRGPSDIPIGTVAWRRWRRTAPVRSRP